MKVIMAKFDVHRQHTYDTVIDFLHVQSSCDNLW